MPDATDVNPAKKRAAFLVHVDTPEAHQKLPAGRPVTISGWILARAALSDFQAVCGSHTQAVQHGLHRPDLVKAFPTRPEVSHAGFHCVIDPPADCLGETVVMLIAESQDGQRHEVEVPVFFERDAVISAAGTPDPLFSLDEPAIVDHHVTGTLQGGLTIAGWAISRAGIDRVTIKLDGAQIGTAYLGIRRTDVAAAFPTYAEALLSGFTYSLPGRALPAGAHSVTVSAISKSGASNSLTFTIEAGARAEEEGPWSLRRALPAAEQLLSEAMMARLKTPPQFLIWLQHHSDLEALRRTLRSIADQTYPHWCVFVSGESLSPAHTKQIEKDFSAFRSRIKFADKAPLKGLDKSWVVRADAGDAFAIDALAELAFAIDMNAGCDFIYADERKLSAASGQVEAFFKPDWSPHLLMSTNYIGRPWAVPLAHLNNAGYQLVDLDAAGDYQVLLACTEKAKRIVHAPQTLYERSADGFDRKLDLKALQLMTKRRKLKAAIEPGRASGTYRLRRKDKIDGLVSIIIPTCGARGMIKSCIEGLKNATAYKNIEIIVVDHIAEPKHPLKAWLREQADVIVEIEEAFNWSRFNNLAVQESSGSYLLFLNDDIEVIHPDWLETMLEDAMRPEVGAVGPQLLYPDGKVQHAGVFLTSMGKARHAFRYCDAEDPGYFGLALTRRNVIGVTGACILVRRDVFEAVEGFDEAHSVVNNDLDFCLKIHAKGWRNIYTPFARLTHVELASRAELQDAYDEQAFDTRWASLFQSGDPFFHRHLSRAHDSYQYDTEPDRFVFAGHPYYLKRDVRKILALKVDHIGDFMTAFPAFRQIKFHFPECHLAVLAAPAAAELASLEPAIDEIIPFEFFQTRSGLGQKELDEKALQELKLNLTPCGFDIAVDLRKHPDTRRLLQHTGAKVLAGFEGSHAFPWLDIARPFEGDERFVAKHMHVGDDILCLVDQVASAGEIDRAGILRDATFERGKKALIKKFSKEHLHARKLVCIHPAAGTEFRQWPLSSFASLIDELIESEDVNIAVIGGGADQPIFEQMLSVISHKDRVTSLIGRLKLAELPHFIASCALFIGNNSGPQHVAASVGVPTVGVHSGVVDAREWGPLGEQAIAVRRDVACSPCYLTKLEDCHRGLACLTQLTPTLVLSACRRLLHYGQS